MRMGGAHVVMMYAGLRDRMHDCNIAEMLMD